MGKPVSIDGYSIENQQKIAVTATAAKVTISGITTECHNAGTTTIFIGKDDTVDSDSYEIKEDDRFIITNDFYVISATTGTLKTIQIK